MSAPSTADISIEPAYEAGLSEGWPVSLQGSAGTKELSP
jgi:hypothetical protein